MGADKYEDDPVGRQRAREGALALKRKVEERRRARGETTSSDERSPHLRAIVKALADPKVHRPDWFDRAAMGVDVTELAEAVERVLMTHGLLR